LLREAGFDVTRIWSQDRNKAGLFARIGPGTGGGTLLSAHTDVVPVEGQNWTRPPFQLTRDSDRVYGRGTSDMKGFLASALSMAERAGASDLSEPLSLSISYDEEVGCVGIRQMMHTLAPLIGKPRVVIVGEPTLMQVATGHKGKSALKVTCHGQAGHSAMAPNFVNAIYVAAAFSAEMQSLQDKLAQGPVDEAYSIPYSTVHIGRIEGGRALNIVPDTVQIDMEFRYLSSCPAAHIRQKIDNAAKRVSAAFGPSATIVVNEVTAYPGLETPADDPILAFGCSLTNRAKTTKVDFGTEAGFFAERGIPTLVIGPGNMATDGHKPDEGLALSELSACDVMMDRILNQARRGM